MSLINQLPIPVVNLNCSVIYFVCFWVLNLVLIFWVCFRQPSISVLASSMVVSKISGSVSALSGYVSTFSFWDFTHPHPAHKFVQSLIYRFASRHKVSFYSHSIVVSLHFVRYFTCPHAKQRIMHSILYLPNDFGPSECLWQHTVRLSTFAIRKEEEDHVLSDCKSLRIWFIALSRSWNNETKEREEKKA